MHKNRFFKPFTVHIAEQVMQLQAVSFRTDCVPLVTSSANKKHQLRLVLFCIQPDFSILQKICINNFCSESSQAYRQDELSLHCAYTFSLNTTSSGSAQSAVSGGWNVNDTQKTVSVFENGDGLFVGKQFLCGSLQLAQVAVDGGLRGAQLGGDLADGTLHIKDARVVQRLHDADLFFHGQPVGR